MNGANLIHQLRARGFALEATGDRLMVAPSSRLTDADRDAIRCNKPELLALLSAPTCADCGQPLESDAAPGWRHSWCPAGCSDAWEALGGQTLGASGAPLFGGRLSLFDACYRDADTDDEGRYVLAERAAVYEFDGGLSRAEAEERAAREWLERCAPAGEWTN